MRCNRLSRASIILALISGSACSVQVDGRDNPYDPQGTNPAPAVLELTFVLAGASTHAGIQLTLSEGPQEVSPLQTAADGTARFTELRPATYRLRASFPGYAPYERGIELAPAQTLVVDPIELQPQGSVLLEITGQVELSGAAYHGGVLIQTVGAPFNTLSAADGTFSLPLPPGIYTLAFEARDHERVLRSDLEAPTDLSTVVLPVLSNTLLAPVEISVCDAVPAMNAPAEGARVEVITSDGSVVSSAIVDALGVAQLLGVPGGRHALRFSLASYLDETRSFEIHDGQTLTLDPVRLEAARGSIEGTVTLENAGSHSGTVVSLQGTSYRTFTAEDGSYELQGLCGGTYDLVAATTRVGYLPATRAGVLVSEQTITTVEPLTLRVQTGGFTLNAGNPYVSTTSVSYDLIAPVNTTQMRISEESDLFQNPARAGEAWVPYFAAGTTLISATERVHTLLAQTRTGTGVPSPIHQATVTLDTTPPLLEQVVIDTGSGFSNDGGGNLILQITGSDPPATGANSSSGVAFVRVFDTDLQACAGGPGACPPLETEWLATPVEPYRIFLAHTALRPLTDEEKEVWIRLGDAAGNWGPPTRRSVTLDRIAPSGTSIAAVGSTPGWSTSNTVLVQLTATDLNPVQIRLANDSTFSGALWRPFVNELTWFLASGDGARTVWVEFRDVAGNKSAPFSDTLTVDSAAPTAATFSVAEGAYAPGDTLTLNLSTAGGFEIRIDEDGLPGTWQSLPAGALPYTVRPPTGPDTTRTVHLTLDLRDEAHNTLGTPPQASVVIDPDPPADPSVSIREGAIVTLANVTLLVLAETGPTHADQMRLTVNGSVQGWIPYALQQTIALSAGSNTIGVEVRDRALNTNPGGAQTVTVEWDTAPPTLGAVTLNSGATWTRSRSVTLAVAITSAEDLSRLQLRTSTVAGLPAAPWGAFAASAPVTLDDREGLQTVYLEVRDAAGRIASAQASIRLDRIAPRSLALAAPAATSDAAPLGVSVDLLESQALGTDLAGVVALFPESSSGTLDCAMDATSALAAASPPTVALDIDTSPCLTTPCTLPISFAAMPLPLEGRYRLQACFRDAAGNAEAWPLEQGLVFDATVPDLAAAPILVADGRQLIASWAPIFDQGPSGLVDHYELQIDSTASFGATTTTLTPLPATETSATVPGLENRVRYWVRVRAVDPAGNARSWLSDPPPAAEVLVGMRAVNLPLVGGHAATDPQMTRVGSTLWLATGDLRFFGGQSQATLRLNACDLDSGQCAASSSWAEIVLDTPFVGQPQPLGVAMVASGRNLWVVTLEESAGTRGVALHGCSLSLDCLDPGSWTTTVLQPLGLTLGRRVDISEDGGILRVAWADTSTFMFPGLRVCPEPNTCSLESSWSTWMTPLPTGSATWSQSGSGAIRVLTENANTVLVYDKAAAAGPAGVVAVACSANDLCDKSTNWGTPALVAASVTLDSAVRVGNSVYLATNDLAGTHTLNTCPFRTLVANANCSSAWPSNPLWAGASTASKISLGVTRDGLHASWWSGASASLDYAFCRNPGVFSCSLTSNWRSTTLRRDTFLDRRPTTAGNGVDVVVASKNDQGDLTVLIPLIPGPKNPTGALDASSAGIGWDPSGTTAGYDFLSVPLGAAPFGEWTDVVPIPDPLRAQATRSVVPGDVYRFGVRARAPTGGLSDDSQIIQVQSLQAVRGISNARTAAAASHGDWRAVAGAVKGVSTQTLQVRVCNWANAECRLDTEWISVDLLTTSGFKDLHVEIAGDELWVGATHGTGATFDLWSCDLVTTNGCTQKTDFLNHRVATKNVRWARLALHEDASNSADRVAVLYSDLGTGIEHLARCIDSALDCKLDASAWTDQTVSNLPPGTSLDEKGGQDLVLTATEEVIAYVPTAMTSPFQALSVIRCISTFLSYNCSRTTFNQQVQWHAGAVKILLREESAPVVVGAHDKTLFVISCNGTPTECTGPGAAGRWSETRLDSFFFTRGYTITVGAWGQALRVLYQLDGQFTFATCREHCDRNDRWRRARVYSDIEALPANTGFDAGWYDPLLQEFGLIVPGNRLASGTGTDILTGGAITAFY